MTLIWFPLFSVLFVYFTTRSRKYYGAQGGNRYWMKDCSEPHWEEGTSNDPMFPNLCTIYQALLLLTLMTVGLALVGSIIHFVIALLRGRR